MLCLAETLGKIGTVGNDTPVPQKYDRYGYQNITRHILPEDEEVIAANRQGVHGALHNGELKEADDVTYRVGRKEFRREELTPYEKGEGDVGGDSHVGVIRAITVRRGQRKSALSFCLAGMSKLIPHARHWICCVLRYESITTCVGTAQPSSAISGHCRIHRGIRSRVPRIPASVFSLTGNPP